MSKKTPIASKRGKNSAKARDVTQSVPQAIGTIRNSSAPTWTRSQDKYVVRRREFVGTATNGSTTAFTLSSVSASTPGYDLNPSESQTFPWLSQMAGCFERYRFNRIKFEFVPSQATATAGRYYAAVDYDYDDALPTSKQALLGNMSAVEAAIWQPSSLTLQSQQLNRDLPYRYVSCTTRGAYVENRTTYAGFLMVAFDTTAANCLVDIWVEYEVEFVTPVYDTAFVQDMSMTGVPPSTTAVTAALGTSFVAQPPPMTAVPTGAVTLVNVTSPGVPTLTVPNVGGVGYTPSYALDLKDVVGRGLLSLWSRSSVTGVTPATILAAGFLFKAALFNSAGTFLNFAELLDTNNSFSVGVTDGSLLSTATNPVVATQSINLRNLQTVAPTARWLVYFLVATAALGAGTSGWGMKYTL